VVIVHRFAGGQPFAIEVRPDAVVATRLTDDSGLAEITFAEGRNVPVTLILPGDVARQVSVQLAPLCGDRTTEGRCDDDAW